MTNNTDTFETFTPAEDLSAFTLNFDFDATLEDLRTIGNSFNV